METSETNQKSQEVAKTLVVQNKMGIHARPAAMIVKAANKYSSDVFFEKDEELVNGKSIMGLMMLAAGPGTSITLTCTGQQGPQVLAALVDLVERKFDED